MNGMGGACRFFIFIYFLIPGDVVFVRVMGFRTDISRIPDFTKHPPNQHYLGITIQPGQSFFDFCESVPQKSLLTGHKLAWRSDSSLAVVTHAMA